MVRVSAFGGNMRKWLFAVGLILLFIGMIFTSSAFQSSKTTKEEELVESEVESWQISSSFAPGDKVRLSVASGEDWEKYVEPEIPAVPFSHKFVWVNITDPSKENTFFELTYVKYEGKFFLFQVTVNATSSGFDAQNNSGEIVGYIRETGLYTATAWGAIPPGGGPPSSLTFFKVKEVVLIEYPYSHLLYPGVAILLAGVALSILGAITSKRVQRKRRTRVKS